MGLRENDEGADGRVEVEACLIDALGTTAREERAGGELNCNLKQKGFLGLSGPFALTCVLFLEHQHSVGQEAVSPH
jgi:hypothetical protein